ncbi:hypothetical protein, partial [Mangrovicoccus algicola]
TGAAGLTGLARIEACLRRLEQAAGRGGADPAPLLARLEAAVEDTARAIGAMERTAGGAGTAGQPDRESD